MGDASVLANIRRGTQLPGRKTAPGVPAVAKSVDDIPKSARPRETDLTNKYNNPETLKKALDNLAGDKPFQMNPKLQRDIMDQMDLF